MTATNQQMTCEQLADLSALAAQLQAKAEANDDRDTAVIAYAVQRACSELEESRREFTAANATIHNLEMKVAQVVAESGRCKFEISRCHQTVDEMFKHRDKWVDKEWLLSIWSTSKRLMNETPATDAYLAEVRAQGVELLLSSLPPHYTARADIEAFASQLRQGAKS